MSASEGRQPGCRPHTWPRLASGESRFCPRVRGPCDNVCKENSPVHVFTLCLVQRVICEVLCFRTLMHMASPCSRAVHSSHDIVSSMPNDVRLLVYGRGLLLVSVALALGEGLHKLSGDYSHVAEAYILQCYTYQGMHVYRQIIVCACRADPCFYASM